ncbi:transmembrane protein, putative, partial [Medicago truncatula]
FQITSRTMLQWMRGLILEVNVNFIMARSTQEVAEGLLKLKGCLIGLIDGDDESDLLLRTNLLKLRTCLIEFNTTNLEMQTHIAIVTQGNSDGAILQQKGKLGSDQWLDGLVFVAARMLAVVCSLPAAAAAGVSGISWYGGNAAVLRFWEFLDRSVMP